MCGRKKEIKEESQKTVDSDLDILSDVNADVVISNDKPDLF